MVKSSSLITVIVPTFNEVENIENFVINIRKVLSPYEFQILFVDDKLISSSVSLYKII